MTTATIYKEGCCQYQDGTPSYVRPNEDVGEIPADYLDYADRHGGDPAEAWQATVDWRRENGIWNILKTPTPRFRECAAVDPLFYHGHSKDGYPIMWEVGSQIDCVRYTNIPDEDHLRRAYYLCEFGRNVLCEGGFTVPGVKTRQQAKGYGAVFVMDFAGVDVSGYFGGGAFQNRCSAFDYLRAHWPLQLRHTFVIGVPTMLLSLGRPILYRAMFGFENPEVIPARVSLDRLRTQIDDDQIPQEYGGSSPYKLGEHPYQLRLNALLDEYLPATPMVVDRTAPADDKSNEASPPKEPDRDTDRVRDELGTSKKGALRLFLELWASLLTVVAGLGELFGYSLQSESHSGDISCANVGSLGSETDSGSDTSHNSVEEGTVINVPTRGTANEKKRRRKTFRRLRESLKSISLKKRLSLRGKRFRKRRKKTE